MENKTLSPCNNQCMLDVDKTFCMSCCRTVEEKRTWWKLTDEEKREVLKKAKARAEKWGL